MFQYKMCSFFYCFIGCTSLGYRWSKVTTYTSVCRALTQVGGAGGIENENEAEDWGFRTVSCSGVALPTNMWQHIQH